MHADTLRIIGIVFRHRTITRAHEKMPHIRLTRLDSDSASLKRAAIEIFYSPSHWKLLSNILKKPMPSSNCKYEVMINFYSIFCLQFKTDYCLLRTQLLSSRKLFLLLFLVHFCKGNDWVTKKGHIGDELLKIQAFLVKDSRIDKRDPCKPRSQSVQR